MMKWVRKIHLWASVIVGIQLLIWLGSGLYFNLMDSNKVSGNQYRAHIHQDKVLTIEQLLDPQQVLAKAKPAVAIKLITLLEQPVYLVTHQQGLYPHFENHFSMYNAIDGSPININQTWAIALAKQSYNGSGKVTSAELITTKLEDFPKQQNPSWRVNFSDAINTSAYVEAGSGRIIGHSNDNKRFADIFFMLHFMDYENLSGFNNIQIILFALVCLWLTVTGFIWTIYLISKGQYKIR